MREMIEKNKGVLRFLGIFLLSYILLTVLYTWYLSAQVTIDGFTHMVSNHSVYVLRFFGVPIIDILQNDTVALFLEDKQIAFIAEGCNAVSIQILFAAFILAFARKWKTTLLYIVLGVLFIYVINILRIALFIVLLHKYPQYTSFLHDIFFPAIIYGSVFLLWMNWVRLFKKEEQNG